MKIEINLSFEDHSSGRFTVQTACVKRKPVETSVFKTVAQGCVSLEDEGMSDLKKHQ